MLSIPPATTTSLIPSSIDCAAKQIAFIPDEQTLFIDVHGVFILIPDLYANCLAGA